ncbi:hypothetical protein PCE1_001315 [Barthelona sp. PCE]
MQFDNVDFVPVDNDNPKAIFGNHKFQANKDMNVGDVIFTETPLFRTLAPGFTNRICPNCLDLLPMDQYRSEEMESTKKCDDCILFFCSEECHNECDVHRMNCQFFSIMSSEEMSDQIDIIDVHLWLYSLIYLTMLHEGKLDILKDLAPADFSVMPIERMEYWLEQAELFKNFLKKYDDRFPLEAEKVTGEEIALAFYHLNTLPCPMPSKNEEISEVGYGVFIHMHYFQHSCVPNAIIHQSNKEIVFRAVKPIKAGDEITVSWIKLFQSAPKRQQQLMGIRGTRCQCERCTSPERVEYDQQFDSLVCPECEQQALVITPSKQGVCYACKHVTSDKYITDIQTQLRLLEDTFKTILNQRSNNEFEKLSRASNQYCKISEYCKAKFGEKNADYLEVIKKRTTLTKRLRNWKSALEAVDEVLRWVDDEKVITPYNPERGELLLARIFYRLEWIKDLENVTVEELKKPALAKALKRDIIKKRELLDTVREIFTVVEGENSAHIKSADKFDLVIAEFMNDPTIARK